MSNYLNNLAAKSLDLIGVIQPRLASLFEPPSVADGIISNHLSNLGTAHDEQLSGETSFETQLTIQAPIKNLLELQPSIIGLKQPSDALQQEVGISNKSIGQHPEGFTTQSPRDSAQAVSTPTPASTLQPRVVKLSDMKALQRSDSDMPVPVPVTTDHNATPSRNTGDQGEQSTFKQNPQREERIASLEVPQSQNTGDTKSFSPQPIRLSTTAMILEHQHEIPPIVIKPTVSIPTESVAKQESTPTIRVTIGRVEVRAIMSSPAPRPKSSRPGPMLSLDDYLKKRKGER